MATPTSTAAVCHLPPQTLLLLLHQIAAAYVTLKHPDSCWVLSMEDICWHGRILVRQVQLLLLLLLLLLKSPSSRHRSWSELKHSTG
jgi:hypothetical protein